MKILVTGGSGWMASVLIPELESRGHTVFSIDRAEGDLTQPGVFEAIYRAHGGNSELDRVIHLAAQPGRMKGEQDPEETLKNNVLATVNVAKTVGNRGPLLCYVSTSEIYGDHGRSWAVDEEYRVAPKNLYGITKLAGEHVARAYAGPCQVLRPSMPYDGTMPVGEGRAALPTFIWKAMRGEEITVHRETFREWLYSTDLVSGMTTAIESGSLATFNISATAGDGLERSMEQLAKMIYQTAGKDTSLINYEDPPPDITKVKRLSSSRLRALGWKPKVTLTEGIMATFVEIRKRMNPGGDLFDEKIARVRVNL